MENNSISFHSIEDKIVKYFFKNYSENNSKPSRYFPIVENKSLALFLSYQNKVLKPSEKEIKINPPSRSAKLRFIIRNNEEFKNPLEIKIKFKRYLDLEKINVKKKNFLFQLFFSILMILTSIIKTQTSIIEKKIYSQLEKN